MFDRNSTVLVFIMGGLGLFLLVGGVLARLGIYKSLYAMRSYPPFAPAALAYTGIPGSVLFFLVASIPFLPPNEARTIFFFFGIIPYLIFLIMLTIKQPRWLKPKWLLWLEQEHNDIIEELWEDVRSDRWKWERRVRNQEQLEEWVASVRRKNQWFNKLDQP